MAKPFSTDLRERVVQAYERANDSMARIAAMFDLGPATVNRWVQQYRKTGCLEALPHGGGPAPKVDEQGLSLLCLLVAEQPDATRLEVAQRYQEERGVCLSAATVGRDLHRVGLTRKKRPFTPPSESRPTS